MLVLPAESGWLGAAAPPCVRSCLPRGRPAVWGRQAAAVGSSHGRSMSAEACPTLGSTMQQVQSAQLAQLAALFCEAPQESSCLQQLKRFRRGVTLCAMHGPAMVETGLP